MKKFNLVMVAAVIVGTSGVAQANKGTISVATYGGEWGDAIRECIIDPYTKLHGVQVNNVPGVSHVTLAKLTQEKKAPQIDVAWIDAGLSEEAGSRGLLDIMDPIRIPNIANMVDEGVYKNKSGEIYSLGTGFFSIGIVYNTEEVKQPPTSWNDLWKPEYKGTTIVPNLQNSLSFFLMMSEIYGGSIDNSEAYINKLKQLDALAFFDSSGQATNLFESGEAVIGAHYAQAAWTIADKGLPISFVVPTEGAAADDIRIHKVKDGPGNSDDIDGFINYAVSQDAASCMANTLYVGPATNGVVLTAEAKKRMPWGENGSVKNLKLFKWEELNSRRQEFLDIWNKNMVVR